MCMRTVTEGSATIILSSQAHPGVFYNPHMRLNRDINTLALAVFNRAMNYFTYVDALSATGIRGIRVAVEVGGDVVLCDRNPVAVELMKENIRLNEVSNCTAVLSDANVLLSQQRFDIVDLDPFGTPMPFLDSASRSARKLLAVTATDTAPLCGAHLKSAIRTYSAHPRNNEYHRETGLRVLIGAIVRCLAKYDRAATPLLSYAHRHYARVYACIKSGVRAADDAMRQVGYMAHCNNCNNRFSIPSLAPAIEHCNNCGEQVTLSGPLWLGALHRQDFVKEVAIEAENRGFVEAAKLLHTCACELEIPMYYDYHQLCRRLHISAPPITSVIRTLQEQGFEASRTHLCGTGIKTNAGAKDLEKALQNSY